MLREIQHVRQEEDQAARRWFTDENWDLYVWHAKGRYLGFQLCYGKGTDERAVTWMEGSPPSYSRVDVGSRAGAPGGMRQPILREEDNMSGVLPLKRFLDESREIDPRIRRYVILKLRALVAEDSR